MSMNNKTATCKPHSAGNNKTGAWRVMKPEVAKDKCISCGLCVKLCPENCIELKPKAQMDYNYCKGCGLCAKHCPVKAITMNYEQK